MGLRLIKMAHSCILGGKIVIENVLILEKKVWEILNSTTKFIFYLFWVDLFFCVCVWGGERVCNNWAGVEISKLSVKWEECKWIEVGRKNRKFGKWPPYNQRGESILFRKIFSMCILVKNQGENSSNLMIVNLCKSLITVFF